MADEELEDWQAKAVRRAAILVTEAMDLLDAHGGSPEAAAHLDLALASLRQTMSSGSEGRESA